MDLVFYCNACDFEFYGGHNHHAGCALAICKSCLTEYTLPTQNLSGPYISEIIELQKVVKSTKKFRKHRKTKNASYQEYEPTGLEIMVEDSGVELGGVFYPLKDLRCTDCGTVGTIVMHFDKNEICPKCKKGKILQGEIDY